MNDIRYYLNILDSFVNDGVIPHPSVDALHPWQKNQDPLLDYLIRLMSQTDIQQKVSTSRLRGRVFYTTVGRFVASSVHYYDFQRQRQWTERDQNQKVLTWTDDLRHAQWQSLLQSVQSRYGEEGFDADYFHRIFSRDEGWKTPENWQQFTHDWQLSMDQHILNRLSSHIKSHQNAGMQELTLAFKQLEAPLQAKNVTEQQALQAYDMMGGNWTQTEFEKHLRLVRIQDQYPEIEKIVAKMGRLADTKGRDRLAVSSGRSMKLNHSTGSDIEGITVGNDLNSLLPSELAAYGDSVMGDLFLYKYTTHRLQTFRYKSQISKPVRKLGFTHASRKGPMIVCIDTSASMYGTAQNIEKSLLSRVIQMAEELHRPCFLIDFSVSVRPIDLIEERRRQRMHQIDPTISVSEQNDEMIPFINGGTSAEKMLNTLFALLDNDGNRYVNADCLWITDFLIPMPTPHQLNALRTYRTTGTRFYGLQITGEKETETEWQQYMDQIYLIRYRHVKRY